MRRFAYKAADSGLLSPELAAGIPVRQCVTPMGRHGLVNPIALGKNRAPYFLLLLFSFSFRM
jgi:hypothetical protein